MSSKAEPELVESVYSFLVKNGHNDTAKAFVKEAKLDAKKLQSKACKDLVEIYRAGSKCVSLS